MRRWLVTFTDQSDQIWRQRLCQSGCIIIGLAAFLTIIFMDFKQESDWFILVYLYGIIVFSLISFFLCSKGYIFPPAFAISTVIMLFTSFVPSPEVLLETPVGTSLVIPVCLIGITTRFRYALLFSIAAIATLFIRSIISGYSWSPNTTTSVLIIITVTGLLWITHELIATLHTRNEQLKDLAIANERNRIAREIHDSLGHHLSIVNMQLRGARAVFATDPASALESISEAQQMTKDAIEEVRQSIEAMRQSPTATRPLPDVIARLVARNCAAGIPTTFTTAGTARQLPLAVNDALYSAVQEGLTNIRKHADARQATVQLDYTQPRRVTLTIGDDGQGAPGIDGGFGLMGVRERLHLVGGVLRVVTAPSDGFRLVVEVPA